MPFLGPELGGRSSNEDIYSNLFIYISRDFRTSPDRVSGWLVDVGGLRMSGHQALREPSKLERCAAVEHWQLKRDGNLRGIVEVLQ